MTKPIQIKVVDDPVCPKCGAQSVKNPDEPIRSWVWQIRCNKVCDDQGRWWSQCMICKDAGDKQQGWFCS